jgi:membrane associated rhomboid family serine protease
VTLSIIVLCGSLELLLYLSDLGLTPWPRLRFLAYGYGGFWPGLLTDWRPNYAGQPALMFLTYGFLHAGPVHLIVNMATLYSLGRAVVEHVGTMRYAGIYAVSILGGAIGFGALASTLQPMVGASGALFGLAGALAFWEVTERARTDRNFGPVGRYVALLIALNIVLWWAMDGHLAWQTHLGGFLGGALGAAVFARPRHGSA